MSKYIHNLIQEGEHEQLDFKYAINDSRKIARSLVAFSNNRGGRLLIGVKDNGSIVGVRSDEEYYMVQAAAQMYCKPEVIFDSVRWKINGKSVLEITIPESMQKPHYAKKDGRWLAYFRVKDEDKLANSVMLSVWKNKKRKKGILVTYSDKQRALLNYIEENDYISISKYMRIAQIQRKEAIAILSSLISFDVLEYFYFGEKILYRKKKLNV